MRPHDLTPKTDPDAVNCGFTQQYPILAEHVGLVAVLAWQRHDIDALVLETPKSVRPHEQH